MLGPIDVAFQESIAAIDGILAIPQTLFKASSTSRIGPIGHSFRRARHSWESTTADVTKFRSRGYRAFGKALKLAEESRATGAADDSILWLKGFRDSSQKEVDRWVLSAEKKLNELVNKPTDAINQALNAAIQSAVDTTDGLGLFDGAAALERVKQTANGEVSLVQG